jgi:ATP-dependent Clp protease, protease subunit
MTDVTVQQSLRQLEQFERWYRKPDGHFDKDRVKQKPLLIKIDSPGGTVASSLGLLDKIDELKKAGVTVQTSVVGIAASMASVLSSSGTPGHRYASPNSTLMIHQAVVAYPAGGRQYVSEMHKDMAQSTRLSNLLFERLKANMNGKMPDRDLKDALRENHYLSPKEAQKVGLVDDIGFPPVKGFDEAA